MVQTVSLLGVTAILDAPDGVLAPARRRLDDVVHALADPVPIWDHGAARWGDPIYVRLRGALTARSAGCRAVASSRPPMRIDVLNLLVAIDTAVAEWEPGEKGSTVDRLHALAGRKFRPQDCQLLDDYSDRIEGWALSAAELLGDRSIAVPLRMACPSCGQRYTYRRNGAAEIVRTDALRVDEAGCDCSACGAVWEPAEFHWLARLLGCEALPAV